MPETIGRYQVQAVLGRGAMGVVYRAHDPAIGRDIAIKLVRADLLEGEERAEFLSRFAREARAAGRCAHPNIVTIHDIAEHEGNPFLAMEFVPGETLAAALRREGSFAPEQAVSVMEQVLDALAAAHEAGIVHRDIKPANIMLLPDGRAKVADFGIARLEGASATQSGAVLGTPAYMSPEQCRGAPVDARSDIFSAGAVLFEMLAGSRPFPGQGFAEIAAALLGPVPFDPAPRLAGFDPALIAVPRRALAREPAERFADAGAMAAALRALPAQALVARAGTPGDEATTLVAASGGFDPAVLATIERRLADHVGPIARHLVRQAAREAGSLDALATRLGVSIAHAADRTAFLRSVLKPAGHAGTLPPSGPGVAEASLARLREELTRILGPVARVLISRSAALGGTEPELRARLATHIADAAERARFLSSGT